MRACATKAEKYAKLGKMGRLSRHLQISAMPNL